MENQRLEHIQSFVGKQFTGSPSPFAHWLKGKVISALYETLRNDTHPKHK